MRASARAHGASGTGGGRGARRRTAGAGRPSKGVLPGARVGFAGAGLAAAGLATLCGAAAFAGVPRAAPARTVPPGFVPEVDRIASLAGVDPWAGWVLGTDVWFYGRMPDRPQRLMVGRVPLHDADHALLYFIFTPAVVWPEAVVDIAVDAAASRLYVVTRPLDVEEADRDLPSPGPAVARERAKRIAEERARNPRIPAPGFLRVFDLSAMPSRPMDPPSGRRSLPLPSVPRAVAAASGGVALVLEEREVFFVHDSAGPLAEGTFQTPALARVPFEPEDIEALEGWTFLVRGRRKPGSPAQDIPAVRVSFRNPDRPGIEKP